MQDFDFDFVMVDSLIASCLASAQTYTSVEDYFVQLAIPPHSMHPDEARRQLLIDTDKVITVTDVDTLYPQPTSLTYLKGGILEQAVTFSKGKFVKASESIFGHLTFDNLTTPLRAIFLSKKSNFSDLTLNTEIAEELTFGLLGRARVDGQKVWAYSDLKVLKSGDTSFSISEGEYRAVLVFAELPYVAFVNATTGKTYYITVEAVCYNYDVFKRHNDEDVLLLSCPEIQYPDFSLQDDVAIDTLLLAYETACHDFVAGKCKYGAIQFSKFYQLSSSQNHVLRLTHKVGFGTPVLFRPIKQSHSLTSTALSEKHKNASKSEQLAKIVQQGFETEVQDALMDLRAGGWYANKNVSVDQGHSIPSVQIKPEFVYEPALHHGKKRYFMKLEDTQSQPNAEVTLNGITLKSADPKVVEQLKNTVNQTLDVIGSASLTDEVLTDLRDLNAIDGLPKFMLGSHPRINGDHSDLPSYSHLGNYTMNDTDVQKCLQHVGEPIFSIEISEVKGPSLTEQFAQGAALLTKNNLVELAPLVEDNPQAKELVSRLLKQIDEFTKAKDETHDFEYARQLVERSPLAKQVVERLLAITPKPAEGKTSSVPSGYRSSMPCFQLIIAREVLKTQRHYENHVTAYAVVWLYTILRENTMAIEKRLSDAGMAFIPVADKIFTVSPQHLKEGDIRLDDYVRALFAYYDQSEKLESFSFSDWMVEQLINLTDPDCIRSFVRYIDICARMAVPHFYLMRELDKLNAIYLLRGLTGVSRNNRMSVVLRTKDAHGHSALHQFSGKHALELKAANFFFCDEPRRKGKKKKAK